MEHFEYKAFNASKIEAGLIHIVFKKVKKLTRNDVKEIHDCYKQLASNKGLYVIISFSGFIPMSEEAMQEGKRLEQISKVNATAYVFKNAAMRLAFKFFHTFYRPKRKISVFKSKEEALKWLRKLKKANA